MMACAPGLRDSEECVIERRLCEFQGIQWHSLSQICCFLWHDLGLRPNCLWCASQCRLSVWGTVDRRGRQSTGACQDAFRGYGYAKGGPDGRMVGGLCPDRSLRPCCPCSTMLHVIHVSSCLAGEWFVARLSHLGDFPLLIGGFVQLARQSGRDGLKRNLPKPCPPRTAFGMISAKST